MTKKAHPKKDQPEVKIEKPQRFFTKRSFLLSIGIVVVIVGSLTAYSFVYADRFAPNTSIAGVRVGGLNKSQATAVVEKSVANFTNQPLSVTYQGRKWSVKPADLGTTVGSEAAVASGWSAQKGVAWYRQIDILLSALITPTQVTPSFTALSTDGETYLRKNVLAQVETPYQETDLNFTPGNVTVVPGQAGKRLKKDEFSTNLYNSLLSSIRGTSSSIELTTEPYQPLVTPAEAETARAQAEAILAADWSVPLGSGKDTTISAKDVAQWLRTDVAKDANGTVTGLTLDLREDVVTKQLQSWESQIKQAPVNAQITSDGGTGVKVVQDGQNGIGLDVNASLQAITQQFQEAASGMSHSLAVSVGVVQPPVRSDTLASLGIKQLIGTATTDFTGSPTNRKINIGIGQQTINRILVQNGTTFSTTGTLGTIDASTGYVQELVIKGNRTVPEYGGGLCQVSTTLFRAVLNAGLPIVERTNHAYRVSYYEKGVGPGLDATVYDPEPDFKWKNDTGNPIYIESYVKGNTITFELYGTSDGRVATIGTPQILETYPVGPPIYTETDSLPKGTTQQVEHPHDGAKTTVDYTVSRNGQQIYKKTFISVYKAWPAQYLVGTHVDAAVPTPTPSPNQTPITVPSGAIQ